MKRLHELYSGPSPPPVEPLRHPRLLKALTAALFTPDKHLSEDLSAIHIHLLVSCTPQAAPAGSRTVRHLGQRDCEVNEDLHYLKPAPSIRRPWLVRAWTVPVAWTRQM